MITEPNEMSVAATSGLDPSDTQAGESRAPEASERPGGGTAPQRQGGDARRSGPGEGPPGGGLVPGAGQGANPTASLGGIDQPTAGQQLADLKRDLAAEVDAEVEAAMAVAEGRGGSGSSDEGESNDADGDHGSSHGGVGYGSAGMLAKYGPSDGAPPQKPKVRGPRVVEGGREHRTGYVVSVGPTDIFIEFGPKEIGVIDRQQFKDRQTGEERGLPKPGEQIPVVVQRFESSESIFICVLPGAVQKADWEMLAVGQVVEAVVKGVNKGGLECEIAGHPAFMPASQVDFGRIPDLGVFVGERLTCEVQRIDRRGKGNIVLSRREVLARERTHAAQALRDALKEGEAIDGVVRKIMPFGAFVDLGGVDGLIHISDLSHDRVFPGERNIEKHVKEGQKVRVQILKLDWDANRISLGLKQLQDDPFQAATSDIIEGAELTGRITKILEFGCFVEVASGVEGLVHISEIDYKRIGRVEDAVQVGEVVQVKVLKVDGDTRKISLSIKQTKEPPAGAPGRQADRGPAAEEILKETPKLRRMREAAKRRAFEEETEKVLGEAVYELDETELEKARREQKDKVKEKVKAPKKSGGLGNLGGWDSGMGLGDLKL